MKWIQALLITASVAALSCNKDKFTTIPQIDIKSISPGTVSNGDIIQMKGKYTDQEGDVDSVLIVYKWYNGTNGFLALDTMRYTLDALGVPAKTRQAELTVAFQYNTFNPNGYVPLPGVSIRDTSATLGVILVDKEKNRSEYKESAKIRLLKP